MLCSSSSTTRVQAHYPKDERIINLASQVQLALRDKQFSKLPDLLDGDGGEINNDDVTTTIKRILWQPVRRGSSWTCMHLAARCMLSEQYYGGCSSSTNSEGSGSGSTSTSTDWWKWILDKASSSSQPTITSSSPSDHQQFHPFTTRDKSGETLFEVFFSTWLNPPIGASRAFKNFECSVEAVLQSPEHLSSLRDWWIRYQLPKQQHQQHYSSFNHLPTNVHEQVVARFWRALDILCRAADLGSTKTKTTTTTTTGYCPSPSCSVVHVLARFNACPGPVISRLVVAMFPQQTQVEPLPLHLWISSTATTTTTTTTTQSFRGDEDSDGLLVPLLQTFPEAAAVLIKNDNSRRQGGVSGSGDSTSTSTMGRYPLHAVLCEGNRPIRQVQYWVKAYPGVLGVIDTKSQLPTFILVALAIKHETRLWQRKRQKRQPDVSLYDWLDSNNRHEQEQDDMDCSHLTTLYQVLRAFPQALFLKKPKEEGQNNHKNDDDSHQQAKWFD